MIDLHSIMTYNNPNIYSMERLGNLFDKLKSKKPVITSIHDQSIFGGPDTLVQSTSARYYNEAASVKEKAALSAEFASAYESIGPIVYMTSPKDARRHDLLREKMNDCSEIISIYNDKFRSVESTGGVTILDLDVLIVFALGASLVTRNILKNQLAIARRQGFADRYEPYANIYEASITSELSVRIGGIDLNDFLNFRPRHDSCVPFFDFLVTGSLVNIKKLHQQIMAENRTPFNLKYPNIAISTIETIPSKIGALLAVPTDSFSRLPPQSPLLMEITQQGMKLIQAAGEVTQATRNLMVNPTSSNFPDLKDSMLKYLSTDRITGIIAINILTEGQDKNLFSLYRRIKQFRALGDNNTFYSAFMDTLGDYIIEGSKIETILTTNDVTDILDLDDGERSDNFQTSTFEQLNKLIGLILTKTANKKAYTVDPDNLQWGNLAKPKTVEIKFDPGRPKKLTITLSFDNGLGEATDLRFTLDTQKNTLDWNLLEDPMIPEDQETTSLRSALIRASIDILTDIQAQAEKEFIARQSAKAQAVAVPRPQRIKRERNDDPVYQLRKQISADGETEVVTSDHIEMELSSAVRKNLVTIPEAKELERKLKHLSYVDREIVKTAITEYNEKGTGGKFTKKKRLGPDGTPRYTLSIGCTVPGGVRALLKEQVSENEARAYEIIDIRYRKDIYRLNSL